MVEQRSDLHQIGYSKRRSNLFEASASFVARLSSQFGAAVLLASDDAEFVTGAALLVDGGLTAIGSDMWRRFGISQEARAHRSRINRGSTGEASTVCGHCATIEGPAG